MSKIKLKVLDARKRKKPPAPPASAPREVYTPAELRLFNASAELDRRIPPRLIPVAGDVSKPHGQIAEPIFVRYQRYAVVTCAVTSDATTYVLQPLLTRDGYIAGENRRAPHTWAMAREAAKSNVAPEDVPLFGVLVTDPAGARHVFGPDAERIHIRVPREAIKPPAAEKFDDAEPIPSSTETLAFIAGLLQIDVYRRGNGRWCMAYWANVGKNRTGMIEDATGKFASRGEAATAAADAVQDFLRGLGKLTRRRKNLSEQILRELDALDKRLAAKAAEPRPMYETIAARGSIGMGTVRK